MGTGKTTVGELLAKALSRPIVDTDHYIEKKQGKTVTDIFQIEGERHFRELEHDVLVELTGSQKPFVITTGGGIVLRPDNVTQMLTKGWVVALTADRDVLIRRLREDSTRPLLAGNFEQRIDALLAERSGAYDFAHATVDTSNKTPDEVAKTILSLYDRVTEQSDFRSPTKE